MFTSYSNLTLLTRDSLLNEVRLKSYITEPVLNTEVYPELDNGISVLGLRCWAQAKLAVSTRRKKENKTQHLALMPRVCVNMSPSR